jgi:uncharacterized membrane protein
MKISTEERALGVLGYLMFLFLIPLFAKRDSMFVQFHARQGGVLFVLWAIFSIVVLIALAATNSIAVVQSTLIGLWILGTIIYGLMALIAIFKALIGERFRMPVVADIALKMNL